MKNFIQPGNVITVAAPADVVSGAGVLVGAMFGIASGNAKSTEDLELQVTGVFELPKVAAQAWAQGVKIYWDNTAKNCTSTASGNTLIGVATAAAANPSDAGTVRLNGSF
jgi:predicted RecA/RadA family phage recombinase